MRRNCRHLSASTVICAAGALMPSVASAASLESLEQSVWWDGVSGLPDYVNMFLYVPDQLAASPPIVVAPHHCQGSGTQTFSEMSGLVSLADQNGFIMIFPEATGQNCWDAGSDRSLQHDGKGDTHAVAQMVRYTVATYGANASRVYSVGGSSGGIMTEALLGVYPDVFMAGVSLMGVPCGCWAEGYNDVVGAPSNGTGQWSGACAGGNVSKSGEEWGDLVRSYFPGYTGHRPRLQHWHGTADTTLNYSNMAEDIKEWTNLLELSETPTGTDTPSNGTTRQFWTNACGYTVYETFALDGVGHSVPFNANAVAEYFGLGDTQGPDPEAAACPGAGGDGGTNGAGGATSTGAAGSSSTGMGGLGGTGTTGAGASQTGDVSTTAGSTTDGSSTITTGGDATSGTTGGFATGTVGTGGASSGTTGQSASLGSDSGSSGASPQGSDSQGCACGLVGRARDFGPRGAALLMIGFGLMLGRRRRR